MGQNDSKSKQLKFLKKKEFYRLTSFNANLNYGEDVNIFNFRKNLPKELQNIKFPLKFPVNYHNLLYEINVTCSEVYLNVDISLDYSPEIKKRLVKLINIQFMMNSVDENVVLNFYFVKRKCLQYDSSRGDKLDFKDNIFNFNTKNSSVRKKMINYQTDNIINTIINYLEGKFDY